jgi:BirA family biotin operon repressor/biotin-[acetyl-CoA-carboxylase] ligase
MAAAGHDLVSRLERFGEVGSTQAVVRAWLAAGVPEVCLAVADVQTAGRGRLDRRWQAGPGQALMVSAGFRPPDLPMSRAWRLPAIVALSMLEAAETLVGPPLERQDRLALKWPNDLVAVHGGQVRKLGGVLADAQADGERLATAIVGIGVNVDWPAADFPPGLADSMWSLRAQAAAPVDREALLAAWLERLAERYAALCGGRFAAAAWSGLQVTTGADVDVDIGAEHIAGRGIGVDPDSGALLVDEDGGARRTVAWGEVVRCQVGRVRADL